MTTRENDLVAVLNEKDALIEQQRRTIEALKEGLETYADEDNWRGDEFRPTRLEKGCRCLSCYEVYSDRGAEARALLQGDMKE